MPAYVYEALLKLPSTVDAVAGCMARWCCEPCQAWYSRPWQTAQALEPT